MLSLALMGGIRARTAPQFVGSYAYGFAGTTSPTSVSLTSLTGGLASAPADGDIVIVAYSIGDNGYSGTSITGYTQLALPHAGGTYKANVVVGYKVMGASPDTTVEVSATANTDSAGAVVVHVWRGQDRIVPFDVAATTATSDVRGYVDPPAITPTTPGSIIICAGSIALAGTVAITDSFLSNFHSVFSNDLYDTICGMGSYAWTSGTYNPAEWTASTIDSDRSMAAVTMALRGA